MECLLRHGENMNQILLEGIIKPEPQALASGKTHGIGRFADGSGPRLTPSAYKCISKQVLKCPLVSLIGLVIVLTGCTQDIGPAKNNSRSAAVSAAQDNWGPGVRDKSFVSKSGEVVRFTISIPTGHQPDQPTPLIVALHYGGKVTPHYAHGIIEVLIAPGLGELNAVIVAPDSIAGPWTNEKNEEMVLELMDVINEHFKIDQDKTLLTGFSMGGHGTWYIGSRNQDRFAALIPVAGAPMVENDVTWTTPIYVLHSRADDRVSIKPVEDYVAEQKAKGNDQIVFAAVDDLPHLQTGRFAVPLKNAVPWVRGIWGSDSKNE